MEAAPTALRRARCVGEGHVSDGRPPVSLRVSAEATNRCDGIYIYIHIFLERNGRLVIQKISPTRFTEHTHAHMHT